jgi:phage terminase large subunit-like protein
MKRRGKLSRAERNIAWCERYLIVPEGKFVGRKLKVAEFMREDFRAIYDNPVGTRRAIISRGRKNAKTTESAMILLLHLCGPEAKQNSQLFSAAQSRDQAALLFALAAKMVRMSIELQSCVVIRDTNKQLFCPDLGTLYRALSAEAATAFGISPSLLVHDELGQVRGPRSELYEALETATAAQEEPLSIIISTQAPKDDDLLSILIDDARAGHDPRTVLRFQSAPEDIEDPFSDEAIRAANPAFDLFMNQDEVRAMAQDAKRMTSRQPEYENLILNRRVEMRSPFVSRTAWAANAAEPGELTDRKVWCGLDLSSVNDLTAFVGVDDAGGVHCTFWLPREGLADKARRDRVPYDLWAKEGLLQTTPGSAIEYEFVAEHLRGFFDRYNVQAVGFDRYNMKHLRSWLVKAGFSEAELTKFEDFGQGTVSMTPALRELEVMLLNGRLRHGDHPILRMCAANAKIVGESGARKFDKHEATGRIDGMVALAMAVGVMPSQSAGRSVYEDRGVLSV